ncbi:uncharacterized protein METZ01_LOCUS445916, partial [marine metagenome]
VSNLLLNGFNATHILGSLRPQSQQFGLGV